MKVTATTTVQRVTLDPALNIRNQVSIQVLGTNPIWVNLRNIAVVGECICLPTQYSSLTLPFIELSYISLVTTGGDSDVVII